MRRLLRLDTELDAAIGLLALVVLGYRIHSIPIAIIGALGAITAVALYVWQRWCLSNVTYRRTLSEHRVLFGEVVDLEVEIVNDKLLPLPWLQIEDEVTSGLTISGGSLVEGRSGLDRLVTFRPMLPYQRVRRQMSVHCTRRGDHRFGPAQLTSGDPVHFRERSASGGGIEQLLVYPKVFALQPSRIASRVLLGDDRSRFEPVDDPSRVVGVREYRPGDALRDIDWRATARTSALLVREFEPSVAVRVALFLDLRLPIHVDFDISGAEFVIAVGASLLSELAGRGVAIGLFSPGTIGTAPLAFPPQSAPAALPAMFEALAKVTPYNTGRFSDVLTRESIRLMRGTSALIVATDFPNPTLLAMTELRRAHAVTAVWVDTGAGSPPPAGTADLTLRTRYVDDWQDRESLELAG